MTLEITQIDSADDSPFSDITRYEGRIHGEVVLSIDLLENEFIVEWRTDTGLKEFQSLITHSITISDAQVTCQFLPEDNEMLSDVGVKKVNEHPKYPGRCTYLEVAPSGDGPSFAWTHESPSETITMRGQRTDINQLRHMMREALPDKDLTNKEEAVNKVSSTIADHLGSGRISSLKTKLTSKVP